VDWDRGFLFVEIVSISPPIDRIGDTAEGVDIDRGQIRHLASADSRLLGFHPMIKFAIFPT